MTNRIRLLLLGIVVGACGTDPMQPIVSPPPPPPPPAALVWTPTIVLPSVPTYDGSGMATHPDVAVFQGQTVVSFTPYRGGNANYEKPSLAVWQGDHFMVPGPNPVEDTAPRPNGVGMMSDPDIVSTGDTLWMFFRVSTVAWDQLYLTTTSDLASWTPPVQVDSEPTGGVVSPAVVHEADGWRMWGVAAQCGYPGKVRERRSADGVTWGPWQPVALNLPAGTPWHIDVVQRPGGGYLMLVANQYGGACHPDLYLATSEDGSTWTVQPRALATPATIPEFDAFLYRSSLRFLEGDSVEVWLSGGTTSGEQRIATTRTTLTMLMQSTSN